MEYLGQNSLKGRVARTKWRTWINLACVPLFLGGALPGMSHVAFLPIASLLFIGNMIWAILDKPAAQSSPGPPGWMKISPIHPEAARFLSEIQRAEETGVAVNDAGGRRRRIRTTYFHRFPLAMLVGHRKNPFTILNILLAKLVRSHLFTRDTFHFSEAVPVESAELCKLLQDEIVSWNSAHPDWIPRSADRLEFPDGDIIVETVHLAPATFEHDLWITCSWHVTTLRQRNINRTFLTWIENGERISTHGNAFIALKIPGTHSFRARGDLEQIHESHLGNCAGHTLTPPADNAERAERIFKLQEETDRRLTELGYQSEIR
ncbi:MAG: hypothetical protein EOP87_18365 [Verrucomicrobiaceae bacterium]|nr:MAG: hypothetical protein EOP87_18365 [Verrucomicrobiaceae bacterium]